MVASAARAGMSVPRRGHSGQAAEVPLVGRPELNTDSMKVLHWGMGRQPGLSRASRDGQST